MLPRVKEIIEVFNAFGSSTEDQKKMAHKYFLKALNEFLRGEPDCTVCLVRDSFTVELPGYAKHPTIIAAQEMMEGMLALREMETELRFFWQNKPTIT